MSFLGCFLLYFCCLHACSSRPLGFSAKESSSRLQMFGKDLKTQDAEKFVVQKNVGDKCGEHTFYGAETMKAKKKNIVNGAVEAGEEIKGNEVKTSNSWKIFEASAEEKRRSTLESPSKKGEKNMIINENEPAEDIAVMDYAQPHRKPPIHNKEP